MSIFASGEHSSGEHSSSAKEVEEGSEPSSDNIEADASTFSCPSVVSLRFDMNDTW